MECIEIEVGKPILKRTSLTIQFANSMEVEG